MNKIREKVIEMMEHTPTLSMLKDKKWYEVEDAVVQLICDMFGLKDDTYIKVEEPFDFHKYMEKNEPNFFMRQVADLVKLYHVFEDLQYIIKDEKYPEKTRNKLYKYAYTIAHKYDDYLEYDWRSSMKEAIDYVLELKN